ncbi:MAG: hypothetical protein EBR02_07935 [Alphaproteobacteria bacterium]|nr:hypothetical protein [Alphaproteobacteria bacterium]
MSGNQEAKVPMSITDLLGTKAVGESFKDTVADARIFLGHICTPAAKELGLLLADQVREWKSQNALSTISKTAEIYRKAGFVNEHAHPRLVHYALENASWTDDDLVQGLWAGLITSSCTLDGKDDYNLLFMKILSSITVSQAKIIQYISQSSSKAVHKAGWIGAKDELHLSLEEVCKISGVQDFHRVDFELDHLRSIEFLPFNDGGFTPDTTVANLTPTGLCLQFYVRCQGYVGSPVEYFGLSTDEPIID